MKKNIPPWKTVRILGAILAVGSVACGSSSDNSAAFDSTVTGDAQAGSGGAGGSGGGGGAATEGGIFFDATLGEGGDETDSKCGDTTLSATTRPVNILLVIDKSGSMTGQPSGFTTDKWTALKTALSGTLAAVQGSLGFGLEFFPYSTSTDAMPDVCALPADATAINIPVGPGATTVPQIVAALDANAPNGGTPTAAALARALDYYTTGAGASLTGDKYVLLATDGGPDCNGSLSCDATHCTTNLDGDCPQAAGNCCDPSIPMIGISCLDDAGTTAKIAALATAGVKTIVVGIPGSEAYASYLDQFAVAGGAPNPSAPPSYYKVDAAGGVAGLTNVLKSVTQGLITSCRLQLTSVPRVATMLNVSIDGVPIPMAGPDGWDVDMTTSPWTIVLKGATCAKIEATGASGVQILYGCQTVR